MEAVLSTLDDRRLVQVDTTLDLASTAAPGHSGCLIELPVDPGRHRLRVVAVDTGRMAAGGATIDDVAVPPLAPGLTLSDLVLGEEGGLSWDGPDGPVWLDADGELAPGASVQLYYQVSGLQAGASYRTRIELRRAAGRQPVRRIASEFDLVAQSETQAERRELSLAGLAKGEYLLQLTLTGPGGNAVRTRSLRLR
jgi:hypothetical protein